MADKVPRHITLPADAIEVLGGTHFVAQLFGFEPGRVRNWKSPKRGLPPETHAQLAPRLLAAGYSFNDDLFQQFPTARTRLARAVKRPNERKSRRGG